MGTIEAGLLLDGRYRIVARRAAGATAVVWECQDEFLGRRVAVKILHDHLAADTDIRARFVEEARTAATVGHPNLVAVFDSISDHPGIVLEWVDGPDLRQRLDEGPLDPGAAASLGAAIADGLGALHARGLVHRDVKPANILLSTAGNPKLTDFGIATANAGDRTATGVVLGTAKYLAPEQVRGRDLDGRTDVFALCAVLYEALTGRPPWERDGDLPTALARLEEPPAPLATMHPRLPPDLSAAVMRGLARDPADRWPSAAELADALRGRLSLPPPPSPPVPDTAAIFTGRRPATVALPAGPATPGARPHTRVRPRRRRWPRVLGFMVVVAIAALGWTLVSSTGGGSTPISVDDSIVVRAVSAFDPEGTGAPGEHDDRAGFAVDGDPSTAWPTEHYASRDLGGKTGVGLVLRLDRVHDVDHITVHTLGSVDWALELRVATGVDADTAASIDEFGPVRGRASGLGPVADVALAARGDTVAVWITDLGEGGRPIRLAIGEITIR